METQDFEFFLRVAELGSISAAAKEVDIAVSVASHKIQRLEHQLKLRLFHRTTRRLTLTEEAKILINDGRPLLDYFTALAEQLKNHDQMLSGTINLSTSTTFADHVLIGVLAKFLKLHPQIKMNVDLNDQNIDLIKQGMDLAIRIGQLQDSTLVAKRLALNKRLLCASPQYLAEYGRPETLQDLARHRCIIQRHQQGISHTWHFINELAEQIPIHVHGYFTANSGEAIRQACLAGLGISNHSFWHVQQDLDAGKLVQVLAHFPVEPTAIYAVIPDKKFVSPKVRQLINFLEENLSIESKSI